MDTLTKEDRKFLKFLKKKKTIERLQNYLDAELKKIEESLCCPICEAGADECECE